MRPAEASGSGPDQRRSSAASARTAEALPRTRRGARAGRACRLAPLDPPLPHQHGATNTAAPLGASLAPHQRLHGGPPLVSPRPSRHC